MEAIPTKICRNCGLTQSKANNYCSSCGQEFKSRIVGFKQFLFDFAGDYFTYDSKIIRSLKPLIFQPGFLTNEYLKGKIAQYIPPLRLYIFISIIFFLLLASGGNKTNTSREGLDAEFLDKYFEIWLPRLFLLMLPIFAWVVMVVVRQRLTYYLSYFIFSLHFHAFSLLFLSFYLAISRYFLSDAYNLNQWILLISLLGTEVYLYLSIINVFNVKKWKAGLLLFLINLLYLILLITIFLGLAVVLYLSR